MASGCGEYVGEVLVGSDGTYLGDFTHGSGLDAPLGFTRSQSLAYGLYNPYCPRDGITLQCCSLTEWMYALWWTPPYITLGCGGPQPRLAGMADIGYTGTLKGAIVSDSSGPTGLEAMPAVELDLAGSGIGGFAFCGEPASGHNDYDPADYASAWLPEAGSRWVMQGWAKSVPDDNGYTLPDTSTLKLGHGRIGTTPIYLYDPGITLTSDWQFFQVHFTAQSIFADRVAIPVVVVTDLDGAGARNTLTASQDVVIWCTHITMTKFSPQGRFRLKCLHLYPENATPLGGNWCDSFHGHG